MKIKVSDIEMEFEERPSGSYCTMCGLNRNSIKSMYGTETHTLDQCLRAVIYDIESRMNDEEY